MIIASDECTSSLTRKITGTPFTVNLALSARQCQKGTTPVNGACAADASCARSGVLRTEVNQWSNKQARNCPWERRGPNAEAPDPQVQACAVDPRVIRTNIQTLPPRPPIRKHEIHMYKTLSSTPAR